MINIVEKKYNGSDFVCYKVTMSDNLIIIVPHNEANRHYQEILEWVATGNTITDSGGE
tara:strand:- start:278 stop:451 length:174 start_codon:yes stop_codon:yes gene_type:complete